MQSGSVASCRKRRNSATSNVGETTNGAQRWIMGKRAEDDAAFRRDEQDGSGRRFRRYYSTDATIFSRRQRKICVDVERKGGWWCEDAEERRKEAQDAGFGGEGPRLQQAFGAFRSGGTSGLGLSGASAAGASRKRLLGVAWAWRKREGALVVWGGFCSKEDSGDQRRGHATATGIG